MGHQPPVACLLPLHIHTDTGFVLPRVGFNFNFCVILHDSTIGSYLIFATTLNEEAQTNMSLAMYRIDSEHI